MFSIFKIYSWQGITSTGKSCQGKELILSKDKLYLKLHQQNIFVKSIHTKWIIQVNKRVKAQDVFLFTRQVARLLSAGLPLIQILELLRTSLNNQVLQQYLQKLIFNIEDGFSLSEALEKNKAYFSKFHCSLIALGEKTAALGLMFDRIAIHQEKQMKLKSKITSALVYPMVVLCVANLVFIALLLGVVPQFEQLFSEVGAELPLLTRIVIYLSKRMGSISFFFGSFLLIFSIVFILLKKKYPIINNKLDGYYVKLPIINRVLSEIIIARISRALATALTAGLPLLEALQLVAEMTGNFVYKTAVLASCERIRNGEGFYQALSKQRIFPIDFLQLIKVGEIANCLSEILNNAADLYEEKIDYLVDNLSVLLEPLLIIILGLMVACLVIAMYLPIFKLGNVI
jgi:type IV pilus assembly protein PilC